MIKLHVLPPAWGLRNPGPFALNCEMALLHLKQEFEMLPSGDPRSAPKGKLPLPIRQLVPAVARRQLRQTYHLQGLGRHTLEEQKDFARRDLAAIEKKLGDGPYLLGEKLTVFDFGIASLLAGTLDNQLGTWATALVKEFQPVVDYAGRVQAAVGVYSREVV